MKRIISASYKDDTPAFQSEQFFADLAKGYTTVSTKYGQTRVSLRPEDVHCIVFWTKNPSDHFLKHMHEIRSPFYFQWTITGYGRDLEPNVPDKGTVTQRFRMVSETIGKERTVWRYDPILLSGTYTVERHKQAFKALCESLRGYTDRCVISFMDEYAKLKPLIGRGEMRAPTRAEVNDLAEFIGRTAQENGIAVQTCSEGQYDLTAYGIREAPCIDPGLIEALTGEQLPAAVKEPNSFRRCLCAVNTDIGQYHRCKHDCKYCYAK